MSYYNRMTFENGKTELIIYNSDHKEVHRCCSRTEHCSEMFRLTGDNYA